MVYRYKFLCSSAVEPFDDGKLLIEMYMRAFSGTNSIIILSFSILAKVTSCLGNYLTILK